MIQWKCADDCAFDREIIFSLLLSFSMLYVMHLFDSIYVGNGKQYIGNQIKLICNMVGHLPRVN